MEAWENGWEGPAQGEERQEQESGGDTLLGLGIPLTQGA